VKKGQVELVSHCYRVWREVYEPILAESKESLSSDLFYRCKLLSVIANEDQVPIAFCLHNNLCTEFEGVRDHSYFATATPEFMQKITIEKQHVFTVEWVTVHPNQRGKFTKIQPADLIMGLAMKAGQHSPCTALMGFSRVDLKADKIAERYGGQSYGEVTRHDITCRIMFCTMAQITDHPIQRVQSIVNELWKSKINSAHLIRGKFETEMAQEKLGKKVA
jgi:hypothetical protein